MIDTNEDIKNDLIADIAEGWIGAREEKASRGHLLKMCHETLGNLPKDTPWCMLFVQYCSKMAEEKFKSFRPSERWIASPLFPNNNCLITWERNPKQQITKPIIGSLCIWQKFDGRTPLNSGHIGVVIKVSRDGAILVVEANTRGIRDGDERGFDGVNLFAYRLEKMDQSDLKFNGFLKVW